MVFKAIVDTKQLVNMSTMIFIKSQLQEEVDFMLGFWYDFATHFSVYSKNEEKNLCVKNCKRIFFFPMSVINKVITPI